MNACILHIYFSDIVNPGIVKLKPSDKIRVNLNVDEFKSLQDHKMYGGWEHNDQMVKVTVTADALNKTTQFNALLDICNAINDPI